MTDKGFFNFVNTYAESENIGEALLQILICASQYSNR